jgi:serine/threonine protein kinase
MNVKGYTSGRILAGRYRILKEIGKGRFGTVYRGEDTKLGTPVAVKELDPLWCRDPKAMARFTREAKVAARLNHPNIVRVHDIFEEEGTYFLVMDYIVGESLKELLAEGKPLPLEQVVDIVRQVASALDYAHEQGVIHRDLKPSNIIIEKGTGRIFITDFGLAKVPGEPGLSSTGEVIGSPEYMAPEQAKGRPDHRSDIYSLGVLLFEMCTGRVPFTGEEPLAVLHAHAEEPVPSARKLNRALPERMEGVIRRALAKHPVDRYQRAGELARALEWVVGRKEIAPPIKERPRLKIASPNISFGIISESFPSKTIELINEGAVEVRGSIRSNASWIRVIPALFAIPPFSSEEIKVTIDYDSAPAWARGSIKITSNAGELKIPIKAEKQGALFIFLMLSLFGGVAISMASCITLEFVLYIKGPRALGLIISLLAVMLSSIVVYILLRTRSDVTEWFR